MAFGDNEEKWGSQLRASSLVIQVNYEDEDAKEVLKKIGYLLQQGKASYVENFYLASLLIGLNFVASAESKPGELWPQICNALNNFENTGAHQQLITRLHRNALAKFGLQRFEHPLGRIGEIQIHAGIPIKSQQSFIERLTKAYKTEPDFNAEVFNETVRSIPKASLQSKGFDAPTWDFINQAGAVADDFVAKCIDVLDDLQDGEYDENGGLGLPKRIIEEIIRVVKASGSMNRATGGSRVSKPKVIWNSATGQIEAILPAMPEHQRSATVWAVEFAGVQKDFSSAQTLPGLEARTLSVPLRTVTSNVNFKSSVFSSDKEAALVRNWDVSLYTEELPLLIFQNDGGLDVQKGPLDPTVYKIVIPKSYKEVISRVAVDGQDSTRIIDAPFGWGDDSSGNSWMAMEVDLSDAKYLEVFLGAKNQPSLLRPVSLLRKPQINQDTQSTGLFDAAGNQICFGLPSISVPESIDGQPWTVELKDASSRLVSSELLNAVNGQLLPNTPSELDGIYDLNVSRGFGASARQKIAIVTGLKSDIGDKIRKFSNNAAGLEAVIVSLQRNSVEEQFEFNNLDQAKIVERAFLSSNKIVIRPPAEKFELLNSESLKSSDWITPTKSHIEDLENLQFYAQLDDSRGSELVALWPDKHVMAISPKESHPNLRFNLGEFIETASSKGAFEIYLKTGAGRSLLAGHCFPKRMFTSHKFDAEARTLDLDFIGGNLPADLDICFYVSRAPWIAPIALPLESKSITIPEAAQGFGDVFFSVAIRNPWVANNFPSIPDRDGSNTGLIKLPKADPQLSPDHALSHWLETGDLPQLAQEISVDRAWQCMLLGQFQSGAIVNRNTMREFAGKILSSKPAAALYMYPESLRSDESYLKHLITTGLVAEASIDTRRGVNEFSNKPVLACLLTGSGNKATIDDLVNLAFSSWGLATGAPGEAEETSENLDRALLRKAGLLKAQPMLFAEYDDEQLQGFVDSYVPGAIFEGGTMARIVSNLGFNAERASEFIDPRGLDAALADLGVISDQLGEDYAALSSSRPMVNTELRKNVRATRGLRVLTLDLPSLSIRLSLLARLAPRGNKLAKGVWEKHKFVLQQISKSFPELVELDLTIAELFLKIRESNQYA